MSYAATAIQVAAEDMEEEEQSEFPCGAVCGIGQDRLCAGLMPVHGLQERLA